MKTLLRFCLFILSKYLKKYYIVLIIIIFLFFIFTYYIFQKYNRINNDNINKNNNIEIIGKDQKINNDFIRIDKLIRNIRKDNNNDFIRIDKLIKNIRTQNFLYSFHEAEDRKEEDLKNITNILIKANKYIILCEDGVIKREIPQSYSEPKITALIASYNSEKTILGAIRSIQNQKMVDIEILIVDDASTDKSPLIIEDLQKEDKRIRIIKNKENSGPLFSKSIGALSARGKYIMQLDSDDLFINENIFNICYNEAENNNIDILEFSASL